MDITVHLPDEIAKGLIAEAARRQVSIEDLAAEKLVAANSSKHQRVAKRPDYVALAKKASRAPSARKSVEQIDRDVESSRNEW